MGPLAEQGAEATLLLGQWSVELQDGRSLGGEGGGIHDQSRTRVEAAATTKRSRSARSVHRRAGILATPEMPPRDLDERLRKRAHEQAALQLLVGKQPGWGEAPHAARLRPHPTCTRQVQTKVQTVLTVQGE